MSLIEIIIVIVFIGVALSALLNSFNVGISSSVGSEYLSVSAQLANYKMEEIKSDKAAHGYDYLDEANYPQETGPQNFTGYARTVTITAYTDYKEVQVTVSHDGTQEVSLTAQFANY